MIVDKVVYKDGEARFVLADYPNTTICVNLADYDTNYKVIGKVLDWVNKKKEKDKEKLFKDLKLKELEGTDI